MGKDSEHLRIFAENHNEELFLRGGVMRIWFT
jgi:hypothetical protein